MIHNHHYQTFNTTGEDAVSLTPRIIVWFSCGAASAVASKVAVDAFSKKHKVEVVNVDMDKDEHPDNYRFLKDVEKWIGQPIIRIRNEGFDGGIEQVFRRVRYIAGPNGAACTKRLKQQMFKSYQRPGDWIVIGMTVEEKGRIERLVERNPLNYLWLLSDNGITKEDCYKVIRSAGIELPEMYKLGFEHANCIGCVKGGKGYWNKIRKIYPETFSKRAALEREIGASIINGVYLDELDPEAGRDQKEQDMECGLLCGDYAEMVPLAVGKLQDRQPALSSDET